MSHDHTHSHQTHAAHDGEVQDDLHVFSRDFWEERYAGMTRVWSGNPNQRLVEFAADLSPASALDVGCGEGADAVWLAERGWTVTGVDISQVALDRAAGHAAERGLADRTTWQQVDLINDATLPGGHDLVISMFMHTPGDLFDQIYGAITGAVAPGGTLIVGAHHPDDAHTGVRNADLNHLLFGPDHVVALLDESDWDVQVADGLTREQRMPDGASITVTDTVVVARRR